MIVTLKGNSESFWFQRYSMLCFIPQLVGLCSKVEFRIRNIAISDHVVVVEF